MEKIQAEEGALIDLKEVLMVAAGDQITFGAPFVEGGLVTAVVKTHGRLPKVEIVKFRRRKHFRKQMGHRQSYTELEVTRIAGPGVGASMSGDAENAAATSSADPIDIADNSGVLLEK